MSTKPVRRPTEDAAITAASRSPRQLPPAEAILADLVVAQHAGDRHGVRLCAALLVRKAGA
ncbi:hypothetical protein M2158_001092 [Streptomyces sp. SAI-144]|uniref:hypothetical protein n=1 Tax=Streptomyces sp. SAI-144 TaxID=2940544 RepID=UPI002472F036|nr:hypothetical protein [Streptomyces sp. SAI-144]MDH6432615.1 hypothetical protein [Streptomyces sp. SAI-144]